jgi:4'-phosphopantetheinyl transferase EntD
MNRRADADELGDIARGLFAEDIAAVMVDVDEISGGLLPEEEPAVAAAIGRRRREFTAGRVAARQALAALGMPAAAIPRGPDRAPVWPGGVVGSISHAGSRCIAVAARSGGVRALGVDIERDDPLPPELRPIVCTAEELAWLEERPEAARGPLAKLIFSAKECAYKCQYPLTGTLFGFERMRIEPDERSSTFQAVFLEAVGAFAAGHRLAGSFAVAAGLILTATTLRPADLPAG